MTKLAKLPMLTVDRNTWRFWMNFFASLTVPLIWNDSRPECPELCFFANSCWGWDGIIGWNTFTTFGCASKNLATANPFEQCFSIRKANVLRLRFTKKQSNGERMEPEQIWLVFRVSYVFVSLTTIEPAKTYRKKKTLHEIINII